MMTNSFGFNYLDSPIMAIATRGIDFRPSDYQEIHSPTGSSEDSVEVKIGPITVNRNKRKYLETNNKKVPDFLNNGPLKKRVCYQVKSSEEQLPFRPWSPKPNNTEEEEEEEQIEPVALIKKRPRTPSPAPQSTTTVVPLESEAEIEESSQPPRVPLHPSIMTMNNIQETDQLILKTTQVFPNLKRPEQRNYKNMTRERRIEANARERTRVHTISAAFDTLRKSIPSYSHNQKLSKLSVLRIACSYIRTLSSIITGDDSAVEDCVDLVTKTIQKEGKLRKKKDDND